MQIYFIRLWLYCESGFISDKNLPCALFFVVVENLYLVLSTLLNFYRQFTDSQTTQPFYRETHRPYTTCVCACEMPLAASGLTEAIKQSKKRTQTPSLSLLPITTYCIASSFGSRAWQWQFLLIFFAYHAALTPPPFWNMSLWRHRPSWRCCTLRWRQFISVSMIRHLTTSPQKLIMVWFTDIFFVNSSSAFSKNNFKTILEHDNNSSQPFLILLTGRIAKSFYL